MSLHMKAIKADVEKMQAEFRALNQTVKSRMGRAVLNGALRVERKAKELFKGRDEESVKGEPPRVQTGRTRASITHRLTDNDETIYAETGTSVEYGPDLEFGRPGETWPHPFMTPALDMSQKYIMREIEKALEETMDNA